MEYGKKVVMHISHTDVRIDSRILKELASLQQVGNYTLVAFGIPSSNGAPSSETPNGIQINSLKLFSNKTKWSPKWIRHMLTLIEFFCKVIYYGIKLSPDIVHSHDTIALPSGWVIKLICGSKLVYDAHELESNKNGQSRAKSRVTLFVEKVCWSRIDLLVSVSPSIIQWYINNLGSKITALVLNSPIINSTLSNSQDCNPRKSFFHNHFNIPCNTLVFIYLGAFSTGRGIELILDAFSNNSIKSHVVFMGWGELSGRIRMNAKQYQNIHFHPPVKHDLVVEFTRNADVGLCIIEDVSLSDYLCLPNKLFEYAFSGIPVLASNFPDLKNYIETYRLGACSEVNLESMCKGILQFENNPPGQVNSNLDELSWHTQAKRLVSAYEKVTT